MPFVFKNKEVEKKYQNTSDADPMIHVSIQYHGKLSGIPLNIADKIFADGAHIALRTEKDITEKPKSK